jgi:hypothetical protein
MPGVHKRRKGKAPPNYSSRDRDDEGEGEEEGSKSFRLTKSDPPANVVQVKDKSNVAMVAAGMLRR